MTHWFRIPTAIIVRVRAYTHTRAPLTVPPTLTAWEMCKINFEEDKTSYYSHVYRLGWCLCVCVCILFVASLFGIFAAETTAPFNTTHRRLSVVPIHLFIIHSNCFHTKCCWNLFQILSACMFEFVRWKIQKTLPSKIAWCRLYRISCCIENLAFIFFVQKFYSHPPTAIPNAYILELVF